MKHVFALIILFVCLNTNAQIFFGLNNYIEYKVGNLPLIISVPHGGTVNPSSIPTRTCNNAVTVTDGNTIELARQIDTALQQLTGCKAHFVFCHLRRTKIDCNRNLADGTCGNLQMQQSWNEFQKFIDTAQLIANTTYNNKSFYIDLHGHGNPIPRLELGYLLTETELGYSNTTLNQLSYVNTSSIKNLVNSNINNYTHAQLLRDSFALGSYFGYGGYPAVPSLQIQNPGTSSGYYNGGYNTFANTCASPSVISSGVQIECNNPNVRDTYINRKKFADSTARILIKFFKKHYGINLMNACLVNSIKQTEMQEISIYPTLLKGDKFLLVKNKNLENKPFIITNTQGAQLIINRVKDNKILLPNLAPGAYYLLIEGYKVAKFICLPE